MLVTVVRVQVAVLEHRALRAQVERLCQHGPEDVGLRTAVPLHETKQSARQRQIDDICRTVDRPLVQLHAGAALSAHVIVTACRLSTLTGDLQRS